MPNPSVAAVVHFVPLGGSRCRAALVTAVPDEGSTEASLRQVDLVAFSPEGTTSVGRGVPQDEKGNDGGTWHWPERV